MLYLKLLGFVVSSVFLLSCKTASISKNDIEAQARNYTSLFYDEVFPLLEGTINFRRTKFHGQTKEIYINIDEFNKSITLKEPVNSSVVTQIFGLVERSPKLFYSQVENYIKLRVIHVNESEFDSFRPLLTRIKWKILEDTLMKREGGYPIEVVADGENFEYSYEKPEGYVISSMNNSNSDVIEMFLILRLKLLEFEKN